MAKRYSVQLLNRAVKDISALDRKDATRVAQAIDELADNPLPPNAKALKGALDGYHRLRVGTYRIIYEIQNKKLIILVVRVAHRREIYR